MVKIKVKFRSSSIAGKPGAVYYQLCHAGRVKLVSAHLHLLSEHWDVVCESMVSSNSDEKMELTLSEARAQIKADLFRLRHVIHQLDSCGLKYRIDDVVTRYYRTCTPVSVLDFIKQQVNDCKLDNLLGTARNYERTLSSFREFLDGREISFAMLTERLVKEYEKWMFHRGLTRNSTSFYIRNLRSLYNKAIKLQIVPPSAPFGDVYTGIDRTRKRAVDEATILRLLQLDLDYSKALSLSRDLFLFSYCTRGMAFVDVAFLRKSDVVGGVITYMRRKTGQQLTVRIEPCIERIICRYRSDTVFSPDVFPVLTGADPQDAYKQYQIALNYHNRKLKRISEVMGGNINLCSYTARHTWATTARKRNVPLAVISEGMGHTNERTTRIYLASFDNSVIDKANELVVGQLNKYMLPKVSQVMVGERTSR